MFPLGPFRRGEVDRTAVATARGSSAVKTIAAATAAVACGFWLFYVGTYGFRAFTLDSARRLEALHSPRPVPETLLEFADGHQATLADLPEPILVVDFIYTRCRAFCVAQGSVNAQLQRELAPELERGQVRLLSISFDPARDGPPELEAYRARFSRRLEGWDVTRPAAPEDLPSWLTAFGVVVIPDGWGGFTHNAALHVVGTDRRLVAIHGSNEVGATIQTVRGLLSERVAA